MRYWVFIFALFCMILYAQRVSDGRATRPVKYDTTYTEFHDSTTWIRLSDSVNDMRITKADAQ